MIYFNHEKIKQLRDFEGLTLKQFAEKLEVTEVTVSRWENGERIPKITYITTICNVFKVPIEFFLTKVSSISETVNEES